MIEVSDPLQTMERIAYLCVQVRCNYVERNPLISISTSVIPSLEHTILPKTSSI